MEHISKTIMPPSGGKFAERLEICPICGKPTKMKLNFGGKINEVPTPCGCDEERKRKEDEARQRYEAESKRAHDRQYSLMDEKAKKARFENLKITPENKKYIEACKRYCDSFAENAAKNRGLLFYGATGRGKTTLACCIANRLIYGGLSVKAISINNLIQRVKDGYSNHGVDGETAIKAEIKNTPLLVLDDLGAEYKTDWSTKLLYELIDTRYRSEKPTIITTNLSLAQLKEHLTDSNGIPRTYDRLIEVLYPVEFTGGNYRAAKAVKNKQDWNFFDGT